MTVKKGDMVWVMDDGGHSDTLIEAEVLGTRKGRVLISYVSRVDCGYINVTRYAKEDELWKLPKPKSGR